VIAKRFSECHEFSERLKKRYIGTLPHFPIRFPGFLMDESFQEIRRIELEFYFQNLPKKLYDQTEVRSFLEFYSQDFDANIDRYTEEEKAEVWMVKNTPPVYPSKIPWLKDELTKNKFLILIFYRASWCPFAKHHLKTSESVLSQIIAAGGHVFGICAQDTPQIQAFSQELGNMDGLTLISDPGVSLALHFHTWIHKSLKESHPTQVLNQPAIVAIRGVLNEEPTGSAVQWTANHQVRSKVVQDQNPNLEVLLYWATTESTGQPNLADAFREGIQPALDGRKGNISNVPTTGYLDADFWKVKETMEGSQTEVKFGDEDEIRSYLKNQQVKQQQ